MIKRLIPTLTGKSVITPAHVQNPITLTDFATGTTLTQSSSFQSDWLQPVQSSQAEMDAYVATLAGITTGDFTFDAGNFRWIRTDGGPAASFPVIPTFLNGTVSNHGVKNGSTHQFTVINGLDSGPGSLRQAVADAQGLTDVAILIDTPDIWLLSKLKINFQDQWSVTSVHANSTTITGAAVEFEDNSDLTVRNLRFYGGTIQFASSGATNRDSCSFRRNQRAVIERNAFMFGHDGTVDFASNYRCCFRYNIVAFGIERARSQLVSGGWNAVYNNLYVSNFSRPTFGDDPTTGLDGEHLAAGNITHNNYTRQYSVQTVTDDCNLDIRDNLLHRGPFSATNEGVRCTSGTPVIYADGNVARNESGATVSWSINANCTVNPTQINHWLPTWVAATSLDLSAVGTFAHDAMESRSITEYQTKTGTTHAAFTWPQPGGAGGADEDKMEGVAYVPSEVGYDLENHSTFTPQTADVVVFRKYTMTGNVANIGIRYVVDSGFVDLPTSKTVRIKASDPANNGQVFFDLASVAVGSDVSSQSTGTSAVTVQAGSIFETEGNLILDLGSQRPVRVEVWVNGSAGSYTDYVVLAA